MLVPSIDLQGGRIVQLVQGETLAVESSEIDLWVGRFRGRSKIQLIDLDAAKGQGDNRALVERICAELPCRVGGGVRSIERAHRLLDRGATHVIVGSALFAGGKIDLPFARALSEAAGAGRLIAAVDSRGGRVVIHGWRTQLEITPADAVRQLEPYFGEFLYTHVDSEGLMRGTDMAAIRAVRDATSRPLTAAGGITTAEEVAALDALGVDAVVGMAIYTGRIEY
ncbi:MAG TPA: HisA/HisF-related TIM barrel protein [Vicinamibacterales bacterium]|nr:HisA/HisF-related TIM barrel protein [Vicinamibacterales bacterium]